MNRIKELRLARDWKQSDLGDRIGVSRQACGHYEKGNRDPDIETICRLCDLFGVTADYLLGRSDVPSPDEITEDEWALVRGYRELSAEGREYVRHSLALAALAHAGKNPALPEMEKGG